MYQHADAKNEEERRMRTARNQSIQNSMNMHSPAEFTATAAIARMDKIFIVVVGMTVK
jgi:hypothetical protein